MDNVRAKKHLGQHFLTDESIAKRIADALSLEGYKKVLEIGPGMGVLTKYILDKPIETFVVEIDIESVDYLHKHYPKLHNHIFAQDFLKFDIVHAFNQESFAVIGNFPYNISTQIVFRVLELRHYVCEFTGMFQKEVAERCVAKPGNKEYGILSVFLQAYYDVSYLFTVKAGAFNPPPKVLSGVMRMVRNDRQTLDCDEKLFWRVVKAGFNQRRKTLRNALSAVVPKDRMSDNPLYELRAERLSVKDFEALTNEIAAKL
jgi:16S rRNA (adenine1518-N6/adenine1519-N6)-dimethyltransferase